MKKYLISFVVILLYLSSYHLLRYNDYIHNTAYFFNNLSTKNWVTAIVYTPAAFVENTITYTMFYGIRGIIVGYKGSLIWGGGGMMGTGTNSMYGREIAKE